MGWMGKATVATAAALLLGLAQAQALRPEVGKPLQAAETMIKSGKYREALAKVREAEAVGGRTAAENNTIERMRLAAASGAGDADTAARSFEALAGSMSGADKLRTIESIAGTFYRSKEYAKAQQWYARYFKEGGTSAANRTLMIQTQYLSGDFAGAARELTAEIQATEKAGGTPAEARLSLLLTAAQRLNDANVTAYAMERLVVHYPKKEYWADLLSRLQRKPNFSDRFALDVYRLSLATGVMNKASDYMEMAQLAVQAGYPAEGKQVVDKGYAAGVLGTGPEAERHKRLRDLIDKRTAESKAAQATDEAEALKAKDGNALVEVGFNLVANGQGAKGLGLMQQGIAKGGLKRPEDAKLHLGVAQAMAGESAKAQATFRTVGGNDGSADLARLWALQARKR
jgi:Tfp pilus assembly protein PilF